jgi:hypothetical protein
VLEGAPLPEYDLLINDIISGTAMSVSDVNYLDIVHAVKSMEEKEKFSHHKPSEKRCHVTPEHYEQLRKAAAGKAIIKGALRTVLDFIPEGWEMPLGFNSIAAQARNLLLKEGGGHRDVELYKREGSASCGGDNSNCQNT